MASSREAMIGRDHHVALEGEATKAFHDRLRALARESGVVMIILGDKSNAVPPREAPPYLPAGSKLN